MGRWNDCDDRDGLIGLAVRDKDASLDVKDDALVEFRMGGGGDDVFLATNKSCMECLVVIVGVRPSFRDEVVGRGCCDGTGGRCLVLLR